MTEAAPADTLGSGEQAAMARQQAVRAPRVGDWVIAAVMLAFFLAGYFLSFQWPFRAALFPQIVCLAGAALSVIKLAGFGLAAFGARRARRDVGGTPSTRPAVLAEQPRDPAPESEGDRAAAVAGEQERAADPAVSDLTIVDDEREDDASMEYVFASAGGRAWAAAIAWIAAFFIAFFVFGAYITVPLFAFVYLRFSGRASWLASAIYAAVTGVIIFVVFRDLVFIPLPESVFPFLDF